MTHLNNYNAVYADYQRYKRQALKWARIALDNHKAGLPWRDAAQEARDCFRYARPVIQ